ncbi:MAG: hypothetical protein R6V75_03965 [Bacteroidales bacterium]
MKTKYHFSKLVLASLALFLLATPGCRDLFTDPLKDKETGEDVTLLLIDMNVVKTKIAILLVDLLTDEPVDDGAVNILFMGSSAGNIITMAGRKPETFSTLNDFLEVGYDPNLEVSPANPIELTITAISQHYVSAPQFISYTEDGNKSVIIKMIRIASGKSAHAGAVNEPYDLHYNGVLRPADLGYLGDVSAMTTGTDWSYLNLYRPLVAGTLTADNLQDPILYSDFGFYYVSLTGGASLVPPAPATRSAGLASGDLVYTSILRSGMARCGTGLRVHIVRADGKAGTGQFAYTLTFSDGRVSSGLLTSTFPSDHLIEPVYYPESNPVVTIALKGDSQYDMSGPVTLTSACNAEATFTATPKSSLQPYRFIVRYTCPDSYISVALSIGGQFRRSGTTDAWSGFRFEEGICTLLLEPGTEYDFRVSINGVYHEYTLPTDPEDLEAFIRDHQSEDYRIRDLKIDDSGEMVVVEADLELSGDICDYLTGQK